MITHARAGGRPTIERLEAREVLSGSGVNLGGTAAGAPVQDATAVAAAFAAFTTTYNQDVQTILAPTGPAGAAANRPAFNTAVAAALNTLNNTIDADVTGLPTWQQLDSRIANQLLGNGNGSLQAQLAAVATPTSGVLSGLPVFNAVSQAEIMRTSAAVVLEVRTAPPPASNTITPQTTAQALQAVDHILKTFESTYWTDAQTMLIGSTPNRVAFNAAVAGALATANTAIDSALAPLPNSVVTSLEPTIAGELLGPGQSLQAVLAALPTPGASLNAGGLFHADSNLAVLQAEEAIDASIAGMVNQYNAP